MAGEGVYRTDAYARCCPAPIPPALSTHRYGCCRVACHQEDISNSFIHLTNHAIQKKDADYDASQTDLKWSVASLKAFMTTLHGPTAVNQCFLGIQSLVINSLLAVQVRARHRCRLAAMNPSPAQPLSSLANMQSVRLRRADEPPLVCSYVVCDA